MADAPKAREKRTCSNCGAELRGPYCYRCGQPTRSFIKMFPALVKEVAEDTLGYDARMWRTLKPLLFSPGFLSREYVFGRRVRYSPPFRVYLVISLLTFLMVGFLVEGMDITTGTSANQNVSVTVEEEKIPDYTDNMWFNRQIGKIEQNADIIRQDPGRYLRTTAALLPHMMFVLLPLFAMLISPFYLFAKRYYIEHLILLAHNHAFVFLVILMTWPLVALRTTFLDGSFFGSGLLATVLFWVIMALWLWVPVYLFIAMKRFYRQGWFLTTLKYSVFATTYFFLFWFAVGAIALVGILRL